LKGEKKNGRRRLERAIGLQKGDKRRQSGAFCFSRESVIRHGSSGKTAPDRVKHTGSRIVGVPFSAGTSCGHTTRAMQRDKGPTTGNCHEREGGKEGGSQAAEVRTKGGALAVGVV